MLVRSEHASAQALDDGMKNSGKPVVVVVDPYSSGRYLVLQLAAQNVPMICVRSSHSLGDFKVAAYEQVRQHFLLTIDFEGMQETLAELAYHKVGSVVAGSESGVELASALSAALELPDQLPVEVEREVGGYLAQERSLRECSSKPLAVIVDPYSSGRYLVAELAERGVPMVCVRSSLKLGEFFMSAYEELKHHFLRTIDFLGEEETSGVRDTGAAVRKLAAALAQQNVGSVIAGSEPGVELADALSAALNLPTTNDPNLTLARKDKFLMHERLRECKIPCADQVQSSELWELLAWARARKAYPVVLKPNLSCGTDGVYFCHSEEDIASAYREVFGEVNKAGKTNDTLVLQEFLAGDEYVVDTVSNGPGRHLVAAVWVYKRMRGTPWDPNAVVLDETILLPADSEHANLLAEYTMRCLDAFGVAYGPAHTEVMLTTRGPVLVEVNCRMHGLQGPLMVELATGVGIHNLAADVYTNQGRNFEKLHAGQYRYQLRKHCSMTALVSPVAGRLAEPLDESLNRECLASCFRVLPAVQAGGVLRPTRDLHSLAGMLMMLHEDPKRLREDVLRVRELELEGTLYKLLDETKEEGLLKPRKGGEGRRSTKEAGESTDEGEESDSDTAEFVDSDWTRKLELEGSDAEQC